MEVDLRIELISLETEFPQMFNESAAPHLQQIHTNKILQVITFDCEMQILNSTFKIHDKLAQHHRLIRSEPQAQQTQSDDHNCLKQIQKTMKHILTLTSNKMSDPRDQQILFDAIVLPRDPGPRRKQLQTWLTALVKEVMSKSFNLYANGQLDEKQTKVFCSENILINLLRLKKINVLTVDDYKLLDHSLKQTMEYLASKYQQASGSSEINKKLASMISSTDAMDSNSNNIILKSGLKFEYQESGNYNQSIMKLLNYILQQMDSRDNNNTSLYERFEDMFQDLFTKVENKVWAEEVNPTGLSSDDFKVARQSIEEKVLKYQSDCKQNQKMRVEAEEYQNRVRGYTKFTIGRKISENIKEFEEGELNSGNLKIKSPTILRILIKWCEELGKKYEEDYFFSKDEQIPLQNGKNTFFSLKYKGLIAQHASEFQQEIQKCLAETQESRLLNEANRTYDSLRDDEFYHIEEQEKVLGKYAGKTVRCIEVYLLRYLNKLIHGLAKISKEFWHKNTKMLSNWSAPPQLMTFLLGDLMRCKFASREKEVLRVYKELQIASERNPEKFKIIRVKNRLSQGTRDVLINAKFEDSLICQIQLAISDSHDNFMYRCDKFNHYIYELTRSFFGPISEMCSIWYSSDPRSQHFEALIDHPVKLQREKQLKDGFTLQIPKHCENHSYTQQNSPFKCCQCGLDIYGNTEILDNQRCIACNRYWICGRCRLNSAPTSKLQQYLFRSYTGFNKKKLKRISNRKIPNSGIIIPIVSKNVQPQLFKSLQWNKEIYLLALQSNIIKLLRKFSVKGLSSDPFFTQNLIFEIESSEPELELITPERLNKQIIIPKYFEDCYRYRKEALAIDEQNLVVEDILNAEEEKGQQRVHSISFRGNNIDRIQQIVTVYPNLKFMTLSNNKIKDLLGIGKLHKLQSLRLISNSISQVPDQISQCPHLHRISMQRNKLQYISPEIGKLTKLEQFWANSCRLKDIPKEIGQLTALKMLSLSNNTIQNLPEDMSGMRNLKSLRLINNRLKSIPESISTVTSLISININKNFLSKLPQNFGQLKNLSFLFLSENKFSDFPLQVCQLKKLKQLYLFNNKLSRIPEQLGNLVNLIYLSLEKNIIKQCPVSIGNLKSIMFLSLAMNNLTELPSQIESLSKLQQFFINNNHLKKLPPGIKKCKRIASLFLYHNQLDLFPQEILSMPKIKRLQMQDNKIRHIPPQIWQLKSLEIFHIQNNLVQIVPDEMKTLDSLSDLGIGNAQLRDISPVIYELPKLRELQISSVSLSAIPVQVFSLRQLTSLDIHKNQLVDLPDEFCSLVNLTKIDASFNCISRVTARIGQLHRLVQLNLKKNELKQFPLQLCSVQSLKILNICLNKIDSLPVEVAQLTNLTAKCFYTSGNPLRTVECRSFMADKASKKSLSEIKSIAEKEPSELNPAENDEIQSESDDN